MAIQNPVIFLPGIQGSTLRDSYPVDPDTVWSVLRRDEGRAALHPDDLRYELLGPARVQPDSVFRIVYGDLIEELRTELSQPDRPTPVWPFAYDWRMPLARTVERLEGFVEEVIDRTSLLRHYFRSGYADAPKVDLVAHSMGGLLVAGYLAKTGARARVGKVVTLATPFRGSLEAPIRAVTGTAELGDAEPNPRDRFAARLTPALYHLLPEFDGAVSADEGIPSNLFEAEAWQPSVFGSIADAIRMHGKGLVGTQGERLEAARELVSAMLAEARAFRNQVEAFRLEDGGLSPNDWLCIVGVDAETRVHLRIARERRGPWFDLRGDDRMNRWRASDPAARRRTGDGTVPYLGARAPFLPEEKLVCLRPRDLGYWEIGDRLVRRVAGFHAGLPAMNLVHRLTAAFLLGEPNRKGIWGRRPPGVPADAWDPPIPGLEGKG
jgi:pimeloyl-ACP methyl ester carboxylesterase